MFELRPLTIGEVTVNHDARRVPVRAADRIPGPYPYYGASGVVDRVNDYLFDGTYLLIAEDGENLRTRKTPIAFLASGKFWVNNHAHVVAGNHLANTRYLAYALSRTDISGYLSGSTQPKLTKDAMNRIQVRLPERPHQDAVVAVLGALDGKIAVNDRITISHELILKARFDQLRIDVEAGPAPAVPVSELIDFNPRTPAIHSSDAVYLGMAAVPAGSARVRRWSRREPRPGTRFMNDDTVMARITPCLENGKTVFIDFMGEGEVGAGSTEFIVMRARNGVPVHLPYFLARSPRFRANAIRNMVGSSGRQRVGAAQLTGFPVREPDQGRLAAFGAAAATAFSHMKSLGAESEALAQLRDALLPRLMSGEVGVREAERVAGDAT